MVTPKQILKGGIRRAIQAATKVDVLRNLLDEDARRRLRPDPEIYSHLPWQELDSVYTICRRHLQADATGWRHGPARVMQVAKEGFEAISRFTEIHGKTYCDLGCGTYHPYGVSAVMYLNGAASTIALDLHDADQQRAAEALADLLCDFICSPERWNWSGISTSEWVDRARQFDLGALRAGQLREGTRGLPLTHVVTDIHDPVLQENSIDIMSSRAVLEHFLDFGVAVDRLFSLMRSGGVAYHHIDLVDHRAYGNPEFHYWSFLAEGEDWSDGLVNRLRSCEIRPFFEKAGFQILSYENRIGKMPEGFKDRVVGRFRGMPEEELSVTGVLCVLRKP
jgi:hypothetical protein